MKRHGIASDNLLRQAAALPQDQSVAGHGNQPASIPSQALLERSNLQRALLRASLLGWKAYFGIAEVQSPLRVTSTNGCGASYAAISGSNVKE